MGYKPLNQLVHDLNNQFASVQGGLDVLPHIPQESWPERLQTINQKATHCTTTLQQISQLLVDRTQLTSLSCEFEVLEAPESEQALTQLLTGALADAIDQTGVQLVCKSNTCRLTIETSASHAAELLLKFMSISVFANFNLLQHRNTAKPTLAVWPYLNIVKIDWRCRLAE